MDSIPSLLDFGGSFFGDRKRRTIIYMVHAFLVDGEVVDSADSAQERKPTKVSRLR